MEPNLKVLAEFRSFACFQPFSDDLLSRLADMARIKRFAAGESLLKQGQENLALYIIRTGKAQVLVDNERVAEMEGPGELIGEMSIITGLGASATIVAETDLDCYMIDAAHAMAIKSDEKYYFLYKVYANILASRVRTTNEKAKQFEIANRKLEAAKKELELLNESIEEAGTKKATDLAQTLGRALEQVVGSSGELSPLTDLFSEARPHLPQALALKWDEGKKIVENVADKLKPLDKLYNSETAIRSRKVCFVDSSRKQQVTAKMALGGTGVDLEIASAVEDLSDQKFDLLFCEVNQIKQIAPLHERNPDTKIVVMTSNEITQYLDLLRKENFVDHLVSVDPDDKTFTVRNIVSTATKVLTSDIFGLNQYLTFGAGVQTRKVEGSSERFALVEEMSSYFKDLGARRAIVERVMVVAEEMLMNAIYDAPCDGEGKPLYNHLPRTTEIHLAKNEQATFSYATDGIHIGISVSDPFGALKRGVLLQYLQSCYEGHAGVLNTNKGGAGRGLHQILENSDLSVFNVRGNKRTEVIGLFSLNPGLSRQEYSSLHYFYVS